MIEIMVKRIKTGGIWVAVNMVDRAEKEILLVRETTKELLIFETFKET